MKSDLPKLMAERNLDALCVIGPDGMGAANTAFTYFVGAAHITQGNILVKRGEIPIVVHSTMERDEAAKTGYRLINKADYNMPEMVRQHKGNRLAAQVALYRRIFADVGISGRVGFYGTESVGISFALLNAIKEAGFCELVTEYERDVITDAQQTKDADEAALIRQTCHLTEQVMAATKRFLQGHRVQHETLMKDDGTPLTIGDAKTFIRREVAAQGMTMKDCIFAIGRDAAVPHSSGTPSDVIQLGKTIIFDIWPAGPGGYHSDITRTWCLGYAPDDVKLAYEQVMLVHDTTEKSFSTEKFTWEFNHQACEMFDEFGHDTLLKNFRASSGYIHGLGHGFGLAVHEGPNMGIRGTRPDERIRPGTIICNEPGLYYPDKGWGVRCEDDYWLNPNTMKFERLTEIERELVVPMEEM
jgi:Xaa-Pro aminopeptidase